MTTSHTPGPWACHDTSFHAHDYRLSRPDGSFLPVTAPYNDHSEQRANARLIAAAPDMLATLHLALAALGDATAQLQAFDGDMSLVSAVSADVSAVIAKAEGRT